MQQTISAVLAIAKQQLLSITDVPGLEAEILLAHVLNKTRSYLHTWPNRTLEASDQTLFFELIKRRGKGEPIAYLIGHREFWSLDLLVTPDVLIPRPETELLVELVLNLIPKGKKNIRIADLGTGAGAIALAIAHERAGWTVHATDVNDAALKIAKQNAQRLSISNIEFHKGEWCHALPKIKFNAIVSNPPYIAENDAHLTQGDVRFEPRHALVSADDGLKDMSKIITQARDYLVPGGFLLIEHGFQQAKKVTSIFEKASYTDIHTHQDLAGLDRVTFATWMCF